MKKRNFQVGTFNLYNLALPGQKYYNRSYPQDLYDKKIAWIAAQLNNMEADIVGFQEVFSEEALKQALAATGRYDNVNVVVSDRGVGEGPAVALATSFPILGHEVITKFPPSAILDIDGQPIPLQNFSRPVLKVRIEIRTGLEIFAYVVHLKSKRPKISDDADPHNPRERPLGHARSLIIRAAETTAMRHVLLDTLENTYDPVIVMGDFNDDGGAVTSKIMSGTPPWRNLELKRKQRVWDVLLYNTKDIQARQSYRDVYFTHIHNGHYDSLDHILVSQEFVRQNPSRFGYVEYVKVFNDHLIDETLSDDKISKWKSDHGQVAITIHLEERRFRKGGD